MYDWSEVAYLFEDGIIPQELLTITDPIEYNYLLVRLKKEFNEKHRSEYLRYMHLDLPYHSRRDDLGGVISDEDWASFGWHIVNFMFYILEYDFRLVISCFLRL